MEDRKLKAALYGSPGSGKSFLAAQLPKALILDTERGTAWLSKTSEDTGIMLDDPECIEINTIAQAEAQLTRGLQDSSIKSIVIDTFTELVQLFVAEQVNGSTSVPISVYGTATKWARDWLLKLCKSDKHVVLVCGLREKDKDNTVLLRPDLTPRLSAAVRSWLEVIIYLDRLPTNMWRATAYTLPQALRWTKDRTGAIGNIPEPTMAKILAALNEAVLPKSSRRPSKRRTSVVRVDGGATAVASVADGSAAAVANVADAAKKKASKKAASKKTTPKKAASKKAASPKKVAAAKEDGLKQGTGGKPSILTITTPGPPRLTDKEEEELLKEADALVSGKSAPKKKATPKKKAATTKKKTAKKPKTPSATKKSDAASVPRIISLIQE